MCQVLFSYIDVLAPVSIAVVKGFCEREWEEGTDALWVLQARDEVG